MKPEFLNKNFKLDEFQKRAIAAVKRNQSVLVSAPTGTGKTLIAEYVMQKCLSQDEGVIYTAPIKALSNQKFREFQGIFPGKVGIITGDVSINPFAPLLIMTTEIFRNRVLEDDSDLKNHTWIIFDEIQYLDDVERGTVWEESLILLPEHMKLLGLSATIPNINELASWLREIHQHPLKVIVETSRPVPLHFLFQCMGKIADDIKTVKKIGFGRRKTLEFEPDMGKLHRLNRSKNKPMSLILHLTKSERLPCIYFTFSRKRCEYLGKRSMKYDFLDTQERIKILEKYDDLCRKFDISHDDRTRSLRRMVARGIAYHHAGIHPMLKEVVEQLFTSKYIKVIYTTETFALGINMPAKTVVIDELRKKYGKFHRILKVRDFFQMAGRGGRRGIDKEGFVYSRVTPGEISFPELKQFFGVKPEPIRSRFNASYATILNLYEKYGDGLFNIYSRSFHYFQEKNKENLQQLEQMKSKLKILKQLDYIEGDQLTEKGHFAKNIYGHELPITELYSSGVLEGLNFKQLGILCLASVFEPRPNMKQKKLSIDVKYVDKLTGRIVKMTHVIEKNNGIKSLSKLFHFDLSDSLILWMKRKSFEEILESLEFDEGEVIRYYRMSIQILREMLETPASDEFKKKILKALELINRGVIDAEEQLKKTVNND